MLSKKQTRGEKFHPMEIKLRKEEQGGRNWKQKRFMSGQEAGPVAGLDTAGRGDENALCSCLCCEVRHHVAVEEE